MASWNQFGSIPSLSALWSTLRNLITIFLKELVEFDIEPTKNWYFSLVCYLYYCFNLIAWTDQFWWGVQEFELRTSHMLNRCTTTWVTPPALFVIIFKTGSHELSAQAGFDLWSSCSLPPKYLETAWSPFFHLSG
jgi:hypothetical protein